LSLGIYLMVKGFKPSPIISGNTGSVGVGAGPSSA
jgi:vancomycin resistance protein YoaR